MIRLNGAMLNIIRTDATDIEVTDATTGHPYAIGKDFDVVPPSVPNVHADHGELLGMFERGERYAVRRLPTGAIRKGQRVNVSYDFIPGFVGDINDGSQCNSFAEPRFYEIMEGVLNFTMDTFGSKLIFISHDEMHGFNRDSRARRLGLSNADLLARDINWHVQAVARKDPEARVLVYADMLEPWHNGNISDYQVRSGGQPGATWTATEKMDSRVIHIAWYYPWERPNSTDPAAWPTLLPSPLPAFYRKYGMDWLAYCTLSVEAGWHDRAWNALVRETRNQSTGRGLGVLDVLWSNGPLSLYEGAIPTTGGLLWNSEGKTKTSGCG